jgi:two-component system alkaline phosphatase synthesis response regulator PhoP
MAQQIILVEDEQSIAEAISLNLELESYTVKHIDNGRTAINDIQTLANADLVILDVMLPEVNGIDICKKLRTISNVPVLFLSAKGTSTDKIEGLKSGGTDYLSKPFDLEELLLRVKILIGRNSRVVQTSTIGNKKIDFKTYVVSDKNGNVVTELSKREVALLQLFISKQDEVISRDEILDKIWGMDQFPTARTIDNFILTFRKIFEENPKEPIHFHSIRGVGYKFTK